MIYENIVNTETRQVALPGLLFETRRAAHSMMTADTKARLRP